MKIALFCSSRNKIPPSKTGGTEQPIYYLAKGLAEKGHQVTLFAAMGSQVPGVEIREISSIVTGQIRKNLYAQERIASFYDLLALSEFFRNEANNFDIIQYNGYLFYEVLPFIEYTNTPVIIRINYPHNDIYPYIKKRLLQIDRVYYLPISNFIKSAMPDLSYLDPIYPAVDLDDFKFSSNHEDYLLFIGRICHNKGTHIAIDVAKKTGKKLIIAGRIDDETSYYNNFIEPYIDNKNIKYIGEVDFKTKISLYQNALTTLFPILWDEPFGNVQIESMSCGAPVVTFDQAAAREVIFDGESGYIVSNNDINEMVKAIQKVSGLDREKTREWANNNFSIKKIVKKFEKTYRDIIKTAN